MRYLQLFRVTPHYSFSMVRSRHVYLLCCRVYSVSTPLQGLIGVTSVVMTLCPVRMSLSNRQTYVNLSDICLTLSGNV